MLSSPGTASQPGKALTYYIAASYSLFRQSRVRRHKSPVTPSVTLTVTRAFRRIVTRKRPIHANDVSFPFAAYTKIKHVYVNKGLISENRHQGSIWRRFSWRIWRRFGDDLATILLRGPCLAGTSRQGHPVYLSLLPSLRTHRSISVLT